MSIASGTKLGPYEIVSLLGVGGMGEVYRATDSNLKRAVAIKVLPASVAGDADRLVRFQREAEVLGALNHPNIAAIYGLERSGDMIALVMELVEGEDLSQRIARGAMSLDQALPVAKQIAEALEAAHEQGIIHRDLKPANIKVRADGTVKVLDFGLAKALDPSPASSLQSPVNFTASPTLTSPAFTQAGVILGTAAYMSPEQARGKAVDKRTDVWAFGCVLFEMLAGRQPFPAGDTVSDAIVAVLTKEPDYSMLPPATPSGVRRLFKRLLAKDPRERLRDIGDARLALEDAGADGDISQTLVAARTQARDKRIVIVVAAAVGLSILAAATTSIAVRSARHPTSQRATRFALTLPNDQTLSGVSLLDISPDGRAIAYTANNRIYLHRLDQLTDSPIEGPSGIPDAPAFSPDGQWIAYANELVGSYQIRKVPVSGGAQIAICDLDAPVSGLRWIGDRLIFTKNRIPGIYGVPANGGTPRVIAKVPENELVTNPDLLPDDDTLIFTLRLTTDPGAASIVAQSLKTGVRHVVIHDGSLGRVLPSGEILYRRGAALYAQRFIAQTLEATGGPIPIAPSLKTNISYPDAAAWAASVSGSIAYVPEAIQLRRLVWIDRKDGREEPLTAEPMAYIYPTISPDGSQVALNVHDESYSIWTWNLSTATLNRITLSKADVRYAIWTTDSKRLIYSVGLPAPIRRLMWANADGSGNDEAVSQVLENQYPMTVSPDGKYLLFRHGPVNDFRFALQSLDGDRSERRDLLQRAGESLGNAEISPDGRWVAYQGGPSNAPNVYVQPFPNVDAGRMRVSSGSRPLWSRNGRELFFLAADTSHLASVPVTPGPTFTFGRAQDVVDVRRFVTSVLGGSGDGGRTYDVSPDGRRFLVMAPANEAPQQIVVIEHWMDEFTSSTGGR